MRIGTFEPYKGCTGSIEYDPEDDLLYRKLLEIRDLVDYHASNIMELHRHFIDAVDDYDMLKEEELYENLSNP